jgi:hypothetical protein
MCFLDHNAESKMSLEQTIMLSRIDYVFETYVPLACSVALGVGLTLMTPKMVRWFQAQKTKHRLLWDQRNNQKETKLLAITEQMAYMVATIQDVTIAMVEIEERLKVTERNSTDAQFFAETMIRHIAAIENKLEIAPAIDIGEIKPSHPASASIPPVPQPIVPALKKPFFDGPSVLPVAKKPIYATPPMPPIPVPVHTAGDAFARLKAEK